MTEGEIRMAQESVMDVAAGICAALAGSAGD